MMMESDPFDAYAYTPPHTAPQALRRGYHDADPGRNPTGAVDMHPTWHLVLVSAPWQNSGRRGLPVPLLRWLCGGVTAYGLIGVKPRKRGTTPSGFGSSTQRFHVTDVRSPLPFQHSMESQTLPNRHFWTSPRSFDLLLSVWATRGTEH
jgi:hypothetical protein